MQFLDHCHKGAWPKRYRSVAIQISVFLLPIKSCRQEVSDVLLVNLYQVIGKARVPIIKFVERKSGLSFDIRFNNILLDFILLDFPSA